MVQWLLTPHPGFPDPATTERIGREVWKAALAWKALAASAREQGRPAYVAHPSHGQFARDELRQQSYGLMNPTLRP